MKELTWFAIDLNRPTIEPPESSIMSVARLLKPGQLIVCPCYNGLDNAADQFFDEVALHLPFPLIRIRPGCDSRVFNQLKVFQQTAQSLGYAIVVIAQTAFCPTNPIFTESADLILHFHYSVLDTTDMTYVTVEQSDNKP